MNIPLFTLASLRPPRNSQKCFYQQHSFFLSTGLFKKLWMNFSEIVGSRFWLEQKKILEIMSILVLNPDAAIFFTDSFVEIHSTTMLYWYRQLLGGICSFMVFWEWHSFFYTNKWIFCWFVAYAFAELIDNALAATAENERMREIEIRLVWWQTCIFLNSSCNSNVVVCQNCS